MQKLIEKKLDKDAAIILDYLKVAYYIAKRELPKEEFKHQIELVGNLGVTTLEGSLTYTSPNCVSEFHSAIASVILEDTISSVTGFYSLILDESTDRANSKRLVIYVQSLSASDVDCKFLSEGTANAEVLVNKVVKELSDKGLNIRKFVAIGTDGASVMTGRHNGVVTRLRRECPALVGVHCAAHRCALAASQAAKSIDQLQHYSRVVSNIFFYFSGSSLRMNKLREIQQLLNLPSLKYVELHSVRWLSLEHSVKVIYRTYQALCMALGHESTLNTMAKGLYEEVCQFRFIALTHLLMDVLPFLGRLSKMFQTKTVDFSKVKPVVDSTCDALMDLIKVEGVFVAKLQHFIVEDGDVMLYQRPVSESESSSVKALIQENIEFDGFERENDGVDDDGVSVCDGVKMKYYVQQKNMLTTVTEKYVNKIVENLQDRFVDSELVDAMKILVPGNIAKLENGEVAKYCEAELDTLLTFFGTQIDINKDECKAEYRQYKRLVLGNYKDQSLVDISCTVRGSYNMPNMSTLLECCAIVPMTTAQCERGFSTQNRIKSNYRTRLSSETLNDLTRISEDGPAMSQFDFPRVLKKWKSQKVRNIYKR